MIFSMRLILSAPGRGVNAGELILEEGDQALFVCADIKELVHLDHKKDRQRAVFF